VENDVMMSSDQSLMGVVLRDVAAVVVTACHVREGVLAVA
jgi:hypothetical protein